MMKESYSENQNLLQYIYGVNNYELFKEQAMGVLTEGDEVRIDFGESFSPGEEYSVIVSTLSSGTLFPPKRLDNHRHPYIIKTDDLGDKSKVRCDVFGLTKAA